jgi:hypothetical protein
MSSKLIIIKLIFYTKLVLINYLESYISEFDNNQVSTNALTIDFYLSLNKLDKKS